MDPSSRLRSVPGFPAVPNGCPRGTRDTRTGDISEASCVPGPSANARVVIATDAYDAAAVCRSAQEDGSLRGRARGASLPVQRLEGLERCPESAGGGGGAMIPTHGSPGSIQRSTSPSDIRRPRRLRPAGTRVRADTSARLMPAGHLTRRRQRINVKESMMKRPFCRR